MVRKAMLFAFWGFFVTWGEAVAQSTTVICDAVSKMPIPYANVFKAEEGNFRGTTSDERGAVIVNFPFRQLTVSHVSYASRTFDVLPDTVFLVPKECLLGEVVVGNAEPQWIRSFLEKFVSMKKSTYRTVRKNFNYSYLTRNTSDSIGYWFENAGVICVPAATEKRLFMVKPTTGYIYFKDKTAGCDFANMKRMVYHDFVDELDGKFIKRHLFQVNDAFSSPNTNVVQLYFRSVKYGSDDKGYITVDTARCQILSVTRNTALSYNVDNNTNSFTRSAFSLLTGWKYAKWIVQQSSAYDVSDAGCYLSSCRYKVYIQSESKKGKYAGTKFDSSEAEITFTPTGDDVEPPFLVLPEPWYMKLILTKKERLAEEQLQGIEKEHVVY